MVSLGRRMCVEGVGTAWIVFAGCGPAVLNAGAMQPGADAMQSALAFGLALITAHYAVRRVALAHFNPAVTVGLVIAQRFAVRDLVPYIAAQIAGAVVGAALLAYVATGRPGFELASSEFGANGFGDHSPVDFPLRAAWVMESVATFAFVLVNLRVALDRHLRRLAPVIIGGAAALIQLLSMSVTNGSANPARSTALALFVGDWALDQLWLFWAAPLAASVVAGLAHLWTHKRIRLSNVRLARKSVPAE